MTKDREESDKGQWIFKGGMCVWETKKGQKDVNQGFNTYGCMEMESAPSNGKKDKTLALTSRITWGKHQTMEKKIKTLVSTPKASWSQYL